MNPQAFADPRRTSPAKLVNLARGQWHIIHPALGIGAEYLTGRHTPCPGCGGVDRFRGDDRYGRGTFYCGGGGEPVSGDGFDLLAHVFGWSKAEAFRAVAEVLGVAGDEQPPARNKPAFIPSPPPAPATQRDTGAYARALWGRVNRDDAVVASHPYAIAKRLHGAFGAGRTRASGKLIGNDADCLIVPVRNPDGVLVAVEALSEHRDPAGKFLRQSFGPKSQGWLVLGDDRDPHLPRYVVEGWATGAKLLEHLKGQVTIYIAFGAGRLRAVAEEVEHRWPGSEVVICQEAAHA